MAADPDPYFALPKLYGAPAYARPPRVVEETERPFDPDDLPIAAARMSDEQTLEGAPFTIEAYQSVGTSLLLAAAAPAWPPDGVVAEPSAGTDPATGPAPFSSTPASDSSRLRLGALTSRLDPRSK